MRTADGERAVGNWLAGDPADGLAFYERKYQTLSVDIELLEHRLTDAKLAPDEAMAKIGKLRAQVDEPSCVGDLDALRHRLDALVTVVDTRREQRTAERQAAREAARAEREALVLEAERLSTSTQWKATGERYRAMVDVWKAAPRLDRTGEQELWQRFSHARAAFDKHRRAHFAELETRHHESIQTKQRLIKEAEQLSASTEWGPTAARYRDLMQQWKDAGPAGKADEDRLWQAFRSAQDAFFTARSAAFSERDAEQAQNLQAKLAVLSEAESLVPVTDAKAARRQLRVLQDRWSAIGQVPRADKDSIEARLRAVEQAVKTVEESTWRRSNPEARARAQATADQLNASLEKLRKQRAAADSAGDARKVAELDESIAARESWLTQAQQAIEEFSP
ncbi:MAG: DUF349 domain-containing protein [Actinomycetes bacterium]